jgi:hypothetical protein
MVYVNGGIFQMNNGSVIKGNTGGGVGKSGGTFEMNGGTISGNTAYNGGGVDGDFTMNGGTISGNTAQSSGGGVYGSNFTMNGGTISGNTAIHGGGVCCDGWWSSDKFTMNGGTITGNTASEYGGGVKGKINKIGGTITGNDTSGGNVVKDSQGTISRKGHAVYVGDSKRKETTAGPSHNLNSDSDTGWDD